MSTFIGKQLIWNMQGFRFYGDGIEFKIDFQAPS